MVSLIVADSRYRKHPPVAPCFNQSRRAETAVSSAAAPAPSAGATTKQRKRLRPSARMTTASIGQSGAAAAGLGLGKKLLAYLPALLFLPVVLAPPLNHD